MPNYNDLINEITVKLNSSINVIDEYFLSQDIQKGLSSGDGYHKGKISILKSSQLLWAIASTESHSRTNKYRGLLKNFLTNSLNDKTFEKYWGRTFNIVFTLLALTAEKEGVFTPHYTQIVSKLLELKNNDGGWGFEVNCESKIRTTSMACFALIKVYEHAGVDITPFDGIPGIIVGARKWLLNSASPNGTWGKNTKFSKDIYNTTLFEEGIESTSWALFAICESLCLSDCMAVLNSEIALIQKGLQYLVNLDCEYIASQPEIEEETYQVKERMTHSYEALGLEMTILSLLSYTKCMLINTVPHMSLHGTVLKWTSRLLKNERDGHWYDKNCGDYKHLWSIAHAVYTLSIVKSYLLHENLATDIAKDKIIRSFKSYIKKVGNPISLFLIILGVLSIITVYLIDGPWKNYVHDFESFITLVGTLLTALGVYLGLRK